MNDPRLIKTAHLLLTRARIDTRKVIINVDKGVLILSGRLEAPFSVEARRPDLNREQLHEIDRQLSRIVGIRQVQYKLENWSRNSDGHWAKKTATGSSI